MARRHVPENGGYELDVAARTARRGARRRSRPEARKDPSHFRRILVGRLPDESLEDTGERYVQLVKALAVNDQQAEAGAVFTLCQERAEGDPARARQLLERFLRELHATGSVEKAYARVESPEPAGAGVAEQGDKITIGGIAIRRKKGP